jgi:diguanylate cyclase (GGDEF)-like protein
MKILLVNQNRLGPSVIAQELIKQSYVVDITFGCQVALEFIDAYDYELIILDLVFPKSDATNLCRKLRGQSYHTPILLVAGPSTGTEKVEALDAGVDDYVVQPFDLEEVVARIRALLRRRRTSLPPVLHWGNLKLDAGSCEVAYGEKTLNLTPKEYSLLKLFLSNPNRVFSRGQIIDNLWTFEDPPTEETIKSHIKTLRQKLRAAGAGASSIQTVYGLGYRLSPLLQNQGDSQDAWTEPLQPLPQESLLTQQQRDGVPAKGLKRTSILNQDHAKEEPAAKEGSEAETAGDAHPVGEYGRALPLAKQEATQVLHKFLALAQRNHQTLALAIIKLSNIEYLGEAHSTGNYEPVLQQLNQFLQTTFRHADVIAYWGFGKYVIGMYGMSQSHSLNRMAEVQQKLQQLTFRGLDDTQFRIRVRLGIANYPEDGTDLQTLWQVAHKDF